MGAWGSNVNKALRDCVPDFGVRLDLPVSINDLVGSAGNTCTTTTTPKRVLSSDITIVQWDATSVVAAYVKTRLPSNLAKVPKLSGKIEFADLRLHLSARSAGATDSPAFTVTAKARAPGGAVKATFTAVFTPPAAPASTSVDYAAYLAQYATANTVTNTTNPKEYVFSFKDVAGTGPTYIEPGDSIDIKIVPGAHNTDALELHDLRLTAGLNACNTRSFERN